MHPKEPGNYNQIVLGQFLWYKLPPAPPPTVSVTFPQTKYAQKQVDAVSSLNFPCL